MRFGAVLLSLVVVATMRISGSEAVARSPSPVPSSSASSFTPNMPGSSPSPAASAAPSATPFRWPTLLPPDEGPIPAPFEPVGRAAATVTRHGIRMELWLSSPTAAPGQWVQVLVRTTNIGKDAAWSWSGECRTSGTQVTVDLQPVIPTGQAQTGNAGVFKEMAVRDAHSMEASFTPWDYLPQEGDTPVDGLASGAWAECTMPGPLKLRAGATLEERFAWYPASSYDGHVWFQPLPAGTVLVSVDWPFMKRGTRPTSTRRGGHASVKPVTVTASIELTGDGPGAPSLPELVDIALADPQFRAWVDADPTRDTWDTVSVIGWPGPTYQNNMLLWDLQDPPATGILTIELDHPLTSRGVISLDPWTGEVLQVQFL